MEMTRGEYLRYCYELNNTVFASIVTTQPAAKRTLHPNPIDPALDIDGLVDLLLKEF
jgi:hypothetical protein